MTCKESKKALKQKIETYKINIKEVNQDIKRRINKIEDIKNEIQLKKDLINDGKRLVKRWEKELKNTKC